MSEKLYQDPEGHFQIKVSADKLRAELELLKAGSAVSMHENLLKILSDAGIRHGLDAAAIEQFLRIPVLNVPVAIARGVAPETGEDGSWEPLLSPEKLAVPEANLDGSVDYHHVGRYVEVKAGQPLARHRPPRPGSPGIDCFGNPVPAPRPADPPWKLGPGTRFAPNDPDTVEASLRGILSRRNGLLCVDESLRIEGSVDFRTGDISVSVPVFVTEDVKAGFSVKTKSDLTVVGCIQSGKIDCGGNLTVQSGVMGDPSSEIKVKGRFTARYLQNVLAEAGREIQVEKYIADSVIHAGEGLKIGEKLIGSQAMSGKSISVREIGTEMGSISRIYLLADAGIRRPLFSLMCRRLEIQRELRQSEQKQMELIQEGTMTDQSSQGIAQKTVYSNSVDTGALRDANLRQAELQEELFLLEEKEKVLLAKSAAPDPSIALSVRNGIFPGTHIFMGPIQAEVSVRIEGAREVRSETLKRAALKILAVGRMDFHRELRSWSEGLQLWNLKTVLPETDLFILLGEGSPEIVFLEGRSASAETLGSWLDCMGRPEFSSVLFLLFEEGISEEWAEKFQALGRPILVPGAASPALLGQVAQKVKLFS